MRAPRERLHQLIHEHGLLTAPRAERRAKIQAVAEAANVSDDTVYRHIQRIRSGQPERQRRSDRGKSRVLPDEVEAAARLLFTSKQWVRTPTTVIQQKLQHVFGDGEVPYSALQAVRTRVIAETEHGRVVPEPAIIPESAQQPTPDVVQPVVVRARQQRQMPAGLRYRILKRDGFRCVLCGRSPATTLGIELQIDHIVPVSRGGDNSLGNLRTTCADCNLGKSDDWD